MSESRLFYIYDPMCSWCYAFADCWQKLQDKLPGHIQIAYVLGGLAPDTTEPMPEEMRTMIQQTWRKIERMVPSVHFNYAFWADNTPIRSTYPACRAILAASRQHSTARTEMLHAIQIAYYRKALNPSLPETLIQCADEIGLDTIRFAADLVSAEIDAALKEELNMARTLRAFSFPSLRFLHEEKLYPVNVDYSDENKMLSEIHVVIA
ncbi:MAG: DsbA family protein [Nitrosomonas sp.]|nr:DsbA family protein [Nitrosomonas sp.]